VQEQAVTIAGLLPDPDALIALEPEEVAGYILECLHAQSPDRQDLISRLSFVSDDTLPGYPQARRQECLHALMEAWAYLEREGLVASKPGESNPHWYFLTRRGREIRTHGDLEAFRHASLFPKQSIHPEIAAVVYPLFIRGEYETAVFQAFKTLEVAVRTAAGLDATQYGVHLMRTAFHPDNGPLTDAAEPQAEREAIMHLFSGAIGRFKNPTSHRHVAITEPAEAVEILQFASHLLRLVNDRACSSS
jgi:uncharacterized protein (TIGR02391 family)